MTSVPTKDTRVKRASDHATFLRMAYCALVLRGFDRERDIPDPILRKIWRFGKRLQEEAK